MTFDPYHVCVCLQLYPLNIGINVLHYLALHHFLHAIANLLPYVLCILLLCVVYTRLIRLSKIKTDRRLLTDCNGLLYGAI